MADQAALVPGRLRKADEGRDRSVHDRLLDPDRARPSARRQRRRANVAESGGLQSLSGRLRSARRCGERRRCRTFGDVLLERRGSAPAVCACVAAAGRYLCPRMAEVTTDPYAGIRTFISVMPCTRLE